MGLQSALNNTNWGKQFCTSETVLNCLTLSFFNLYIRWSQIGSLKLIVCVQVKKTVTTVFSLNLRRSNTSWNPAGAGCWVHIQRRICHLLIPGISPIWVYSSNILTACLTWEAILILWWTKPEQPNTQHELKKDPLKAIITILPPAY